MKKLFRILAGVLGAAVILATLLLAGCSAQQNAAPASAQAANPVMAAAPVTTSDSTSNSAPQEGIKVHGQWTIDVINPDGTAAGHYEFENALTANGTYALTKILSRQSTMGGWEIVLNAAPAGSTAVTGNDAFTNSNGDPYPGHIGESNYPANGQPNNFTTLTVSASSSAPYTVTLSGSAVATRNGIIASVGTGFSAPDADWNVPLGGYNGLYSFTAKDLPSQISITAGQQVAVTVVISFS